MASDEFEEQAAEIASAAAGFELDGRIAAACRGSGNPAALAWLAEGLALRPELVVVDLGGGLGGPAAWLERHYRCRVVAADPSEGAARGARDLFELAVVRSTATAGPFRAGAAHVALVLGVLSVVDDPAAVLVEAARVASRVGILEWCSTEAAAVCAGGSRFPTPDELHAATGAAGLSLDQSVPFDVAVPNPWGTAVEAASTGSTGDERAVEAAIDAGRLRVRLAVATRR